MNLHNEMILEQYQENLDTFQIIRDIVLEKLHSFVEDLGILINSVEGRVKTRASLAGKLDLKGEKYRNIFDITDIVGARVVVFFSDHIDKFAAKLENTFAIDWENSVDKRKAMRIDQFGYASLHYICSIPESLYQNPDHPNVNKFRFEVQLRTTLQHAWASIAHDTGYKSDVEVPSEYLRGLNRLAGLLELADENFSQIRNSIDEYRRRVKSVVADGDFSSVELNIDSYQAYLENGGFQKLTARIASINNMEIEPISLRNFLKVFKALGFQTLKDLDDMVKHYSDLAYRFALREFDGKDVDIITTATAPLMLSVVFILSQGLGEGVIKRLLDSLHGERKSNEKQAMRLTKIGISMGIVPNE